MSEDTANAGNTAEAGSENPEASGSRTFTQEDVNRMLGLITSQNVTAPKQRVGVV